MESVRTSSERRWQNGIAERWVGVCRQELVEYVIAMGESHLKRLLSDYVRCHHEDRSHPGLVSRVKGQPTFWGRMRF